MVAGDARPGRVVVAEEESAREEVDCAHRDGGVLVRDPGGSRSPTPPRPLPVHPVDRGGAARRDLAGEDAAATKKRKADAVHQPTQLTSSRRMVNGPKAH